MQELKLQIAGLFTHPSDLGQSSPPGALSIADNIIIDQENVASPRRGFGRSFAALPGSATAQALHFYQTYMIAHTSANLMYYYSTALANSSANFTGTGAWTAIPGSYTPVTGTKVHFVEANQNLYWTTSTGVQKLDAYNNTPTLAGAYKGLDIQSSIVSATGNWLPNNSRTAYRVVWGYKDANQNLILGTPSQREAITNTSGSTSSVQLVISVPAGVTTAWFFQVYRAQAVDNTYAVVEPNDELGLVYESNPTNAQITAATITITDITPDTLRGATIYTAASQQGLANGNERPPLATDMAVYKTVAFYTNTVSKQRFNATLLAVGGTNGLAAGNTITVGGITYTGAASENIASAQFAVVTTGSAAQNIHDTAISLIRVINRYSSSLVYAYYESGPEDLPGQILFEERGIGGGTFSVSSTNSVAWSPVFANNGTSSNDAFKNAVFYSKPSQPDAVPLGNYFFAGSADKAILRVLPLRDSVFLLKEDGIFRLSGEDASSFRVDLFDSTTHLIAAETAVVLNNQIYALTDQGVVAITESGVQVKSRPIEVSLLTLIGINPTVLKSASFGISYETERKYILFVPTQSGDTGPTQAYVFNTFTNTWTRWPLTKTCGGVNIYDGKLYLGDTATSYVNQERKALTYSDYVDYGFSTTISAIDATKKILTVTSADNINVGDVISQSASIFSIVTAVNTLTSQVTMQFVAQFTTAAADVLHAISSSIAWIPITGGNPGSLKHYREVSLLFKSDFTGTGTLLFSSDVTPSQQAETITGTQLGLWGLFSWGGVPWGGNNVRRPIRVYVSRDHQRCSQLTLNFKHSTGYAKYALSGISIIGSNGAFGMDHERIAT